MIVLRPPAFVMCVSNVVFVFPLFVLLTICMSNACYYDFLMILCISFDIMHLLMVPIIMPITMILLFGLFDEASSGKSACDCE